MSDMQIFEAKLDRASALMFAQDTAIIDELWSDGFQLVGSEENEIAVKRDELETLIAALFAAPFKLRWDWDSKSLRIENDIAWVFAQGHLEFVFGDHIDRVSYRLVAIFRQQGSDWKWRLYSGSEPMAPRGP